MKILKKYVLQYEPFLGALIIRYTDYKGAPKLKLHLQLSGGVGCFTENIWAPPSLDKQIDSVELKLKQELNQIINFNWGNGNHITNSMRVANRENQQYAQKLLELIKTGAIQQELFEVV